MAICFDGKNLVNAVSALMGVVQNGEARCKVNGVVTTFDVTTEDGARDFLMSAAEEAHAKGGQIVVGTIAEVVYRSIGVVFEDADDSMYPAPLTRQEGAITHIVYFWQTL